MGLAVALPVDVVALWRYRAAVRRVVLRAAAPVARRTGRIDLDDVRDRIDRLYAAVERITGFRRALTVAVGFAYVGWVFFALPLYLSGLALSLPVPALLVAFLVPAGSTPTPGGLAAIEGTLVVLLGADGTDGPGGARGHGRLSADELLIRRRRRRGRGAVGGAGPR